MASSLDAYKRLRKHEEDNKPGQFSYNKQKPVYSFNEKRPEYTYDDSRLQEYYDKLMNRKDFSFDINGNALFNQYKDYYQKQGQLAMMDTMGQASALTGGFGNSYAASAGQQAYQQNLDKLNDVVPELYQLALQQYQMEGDNLQSMYGILADDRDFAYNKYLGDVDIWQGERDFAYQKYRGDTDDYYTDKGFAYDQYRDAMADWESNRDYLYGQYIDQRDYEHTLERDKVADKQWQQEYGLKVQQFAEEVRQFERQYDLSEREFEEMCRQFALEYDLDERQLAEDVRQYNETMAFNQEQAAISNSQWEQEYAHAMEQDRLDNEYRDNVFAYESGAGQYIGNIVNNTEVPVVGQIANGNNYTDEASGQQSFSTYEDAAAYLRQKGATTSDGGLMTKSEWARRKAAGSTADEVKYSSYSEYLNAFVSWRLANPTV